MFEKRIDVEIGQGFWFRKHQNRWFRNTVMV